MSELDANSPDGMLIAATLAGEEQAFALLVARYQRALLRTAISRVTQRELAEEAVQEAFLCAHRWLATYDSRFSFRTWLWTILLNQCARQAKREQRSGFRVQGSELRGQRSEVGDRAGRPLETLLKRETSEQVQELLGRLPVMQADALRLRFFGELTFPEIAAALGCSEAGAKHRVKAGLLKLARWLNQRASANVSGCGESGVAGGGPGASLLPAKGQAAPGAGLLPANDQNGGDVL